MKRYRAPLLSLLTIAIFAVLVYTLSSSLFAPPTPTPEATGHVPTTAPESVNQSTIKFTPPDTSLSFTYPKTWTLTESPNLSNLPPLPKDQLLGAWRVSSPVATSPSTVEFALFNVDPSDQSLQSLVSCDNQPVVCQTLGIDGVNFIKLTNQDSTTTRHLLFGRQDNNLILIMGSFTSDQAADVDDIINSLTI